MPLFSIQPSFAAGELSPAMWARIDLAKYAVGARTMRNFFVHAHGGASNRPGLEFIAFPKYHNKAAGLIPFQFSSQQAYVIEAGDLYMRFFMDGGQILNDANAIYEIATPYLATELRKLKVTQSADVLYLCNVGHKPRTLSRKGHADWTMAEFDYQDGPYLTMNSKDTTITASATTGNINLTATDDVFLAGHVGSIWKLGHTMPSKNVWGFPNAPVWSATSAYLKNNVVKYGSKLYFALNPIGDPGGGSNAAPDTDTTNWDESSPNLTMEIMVYKTWRAETSGYWSGNIKIMRWDKPTSTWKEVRSLSGSEDRNYSISEDVDEPVLMRIESTNFRQINKENNAPNLQGYISFETAHAPYEGWLQITGVTDGKHAAATVKKDIGSIDATTDWAEGAWSNVRGYPLTVVFYPGDRLVFASSTYEPQTLWMSKVADYVNFGVSPDEVKDDDGVTRTLSSRKVNNILAIVPLKNKLAAFTSEAEWMIGPGNQSTAITPTAFDAQVEGYRGSSEVDPLVIGNRLLFVQAKGATVQDVGYDISADGLVGSDLSVLSKHLFKNRKIVAWAYQQEPDSIAWAIRDDGILLGLTYLREHEVWAWHRHDTQGFFEDLCTIPGDDHNEVWFIVRRGDKRYIERMAPRMTVPAGLYESDPTYKSEMMKRAWFVDCGLRYEGAPTKVFSGLDHLEGKEVAILADGFVMPRQVVTGGKVDFSSIKGTAGFSIVTVGLPYSSDLETLNAEYTLKDGTAQARLKKVSTVSMRVEDSRGGLIGPNANRLDPMKVTIKEYGAALDLFTGDVKLTMQGGYDPGGRVFIRQEDPLPITILAVMPNIEHGG